MGQHCQERRLCAKRSRVGTAAAKTFQRGDAPYPDHEVYEGIHSSGVMIHLASQEVNPEKHEHDWEMERPSAYFGAHSQAGASEPVKIDCVFRAEKVTGSS